MHPPAPHVIYATVRYGMLGTCSDYGSLGDGYLRVLSHILAEFLLADVDGDIAAGIDGLVEGVEVGIDLGLQYCCLVFHEVVTDVADGDPVEALVGVLKCDKKSFVKRGGTNVDGDAAGEDTILPVEVQYLVFCTEAFMIGRIFTGKYVRIRWGYIGGGVVEVFITSVKNGGCLEHDQVALYSSPVLGSFNRD